MHDIPSGGAAGIGHVPTGVARLELNSTEISSIRAAVRQVQGEVDSVECARFLQELPMYSFHLPERLVRTVREFRAGMCAALVVSGYPVDTVRLPPTPPHWRERDQDATREFDFLMVLLGGLLGEPFGWRSLQDGRLLNDILPIKGDETAQTGHGSTAPLELHCEDAFHDCRCDYLMLMCLRNPDGVETLVSTVERPSLDPATLEVLFQARFAIRPDDEHVARAAEAGVDSLGGMVANPPAVAALFGDPAAPYLRVDPPYMTTYQADDTAASRALSVLFQKLSESIQRIVLRPGDILLIDNYRALHGRQPFQARYDGSDRWNRRLLVTRDIRRSRAMRSDVSSPVLC